MLTLFAYPKPFTDPHIAMIQRNAIRSWTLLDIKPRIILFGSEPGVADMCAELNLEHCADTVRNEFGTPLLHDVFAKAEQLSSGRYLCYVNADIILLSDFSKAVSQLAEDPAVLFPWARFMLGGRPWNIHVNSPLEFLPGWQETIKKRVSTSGELRNEWACDYFLFPKGTWGDLPPFALGRRAFDNALMFLCRRRGGWLIDASLGITAIHQLHDYPAHLTGDYSSALFSSGAEGNRNVELLGGRDRLLKWYYATHLYSSQGFSINWTGLRRYWDPREKSGKAFYRSLFLR